MSSVFEFPATAPAFDSGTYAATASFRADADEISRRHEEVDAAQAIAVFRRAQATLDDLAPSAGRDLESLSIDDLRLLAAELHVPDRCRITDKWELIDEIRRRL